MDGHYGLSLKKLELARTIESVSCKLNTNFHKIAGIMKFERTSPENSLPGAYPNR